MADVILDSSDPIASLWSEQAACRAPFTFDFSSGSVTATLTDLSAVSTEAPQIADGLLSQGLSAGASDIHLEPSLAGLVVRRRRDGLLAIINTLPTEVGRAVVSTIKIRAGLDIAEKRRPQDGRLSFNYGGRSVDIRASTMPGQFGEKLVLRLLDSSSGLTHLDSLGMLDSDRVGVEETLSLPDGLFLLTGPTGSGKTTTLYTMLRHLSTPEVNIQTIEDPIEYRLPGINQSQVKPEISYTFANALRSFLRQDPDIIMVGEIRDSETLAVAIQAALTGHRVLSTLHTNDASSAIPRLLDLGAEPFLLAATLRLVVAQRLVRRLCECHQAGNVESCAICGASGFSGRIGLFECLVVNAALGTSISERASLQSIRSIATQNGMKSLKEDGDTKISMGWTTKEEVERVVQ